MIVGGGAAGALSPPSAPARCAAIAFAEEFCGYSLLALSFARDAVRRASMLTLEQGLWVEQDLSTLAYQTEDAVEGMGAFVEKRKPTFQDR